MHTEGHDMGKDVAGNTPPAAQAPKYDAEHPGYETTDVRVSGIAWFLACLFGTVLVFFLLCWGVGKGINALLVKHDGPPNKWTLASGNAPEGKTGDLTSNAAIEQKQLAQVTSNFPAPRLDIDDGNQSTADLHAREDLLLEHYSTVDGQPGTIRIPIERAMQLIAQRGLPVATPSQNAGETLAHAAPPQVHEPLTTGFARTGYELQTIEAREQKLESEKAEQAEK
ncbi:MAG TPA: hypothetical protein VN612_07855 [Acidobacteriaceae bacterium]|nr:hypothetical protein [Acidobacteriaceae bacterium]